MHPAGSKLERLPHCADTAAAAPRLASGATECRAFLIPTAPWGGSGRSMATKLPTYDGNEEVCGACMMGGELMCCENCPAAFHFLCAGYGERAPRRGGLH